MSKTIQHYRNDAKQADEVKDREEKRREANRRMWKQREERWEKLYGRPMR